MAVSPLVLGSEVLLTGDITQNKWVGARSARELEKSLGFGAGRLSAGWKVLLLKQKLAPGDFYFSGITLRSGGKFGLPADTPEADKARPSVHDMIMRETGAAGYQERQAKALSTLTDKGPDRLVKVVANTRHSATMRPSEQYPMGGGGLQWTLIRPCKFFVAMTVDENSIASIPTGFSGFLGESADYDVRAKFARYLNEA
jgi:hypothetical protein